MKRIRGILLCLLTVVFLVPAALPVFAADGAGATAVPDVGSNRYCLDLAEVLSPEFESKVEAQNKENKDYGEVVIVTVKSLGGAALDTFSRELFDKWEIGTKEKHKGLLLLMVIEDDDYYAIAGEGVSSQFTVEYLNQLFKTDVEPDFAAKSYEAAAQKFLDTVQQRIKLVADAGQSSSESQSSGIGDAIWGFVKALLIIIAIVVALGILFVVIVNLRAKKRRQTHRPRSSVRSRTTGTTHSGESSVAHTRRVELRPEEQLTTEEEQDDDSFGS